MPPSHQTTFPELEYCRSVSCLQKNVHVEHGRGEQTIRPMMKQTWPIFREFMACGNTSRGLHVIIKNLAIGLISTNNCLN